MSDPMLQLLRDMPVFGGVAEDTLNFLLQSAPVVSISEGDYFFREGDDALSMFVLEKGEVAILKAWKGRQRLLRNLKRGDCFGEMALIDLFPRSASVRADQDCTAIELSSATLYEVYKRNLEQFAIIQMNIARELSRRLRIADERLFRALIEAEVIDEGVSILT
jgi:CRP/FNR family cyclic AMP-dependent transcriptional regulator